MILAAIEIVRKPSHNIGKVLLSCVVFAAALVGSTWNNNKHYRSNSTETFQYEEIEFWMNPTRNRMVTDRLTMPTGKSIALDEFKTVVSRLEKVAYDKVCNIGETIYDDSLRLLL